MRKFSDEEKQQRAFLRVARIMHEWWDESEGVYCDTRILLDPFIPNKYVEYGKSINVSNDSKYHREHIVPRKCICDQCFKMFEDKVSIEEAAEFIQRYLKIIFISKDEQKRLDGNQKNGGTGLKQKMPDEMPLESSNMFARLTVTKIEFTPFDHTINCICSSCVNDRKPGPKSS